MAFLAGATRHDTNALAAVTLPDGHRLTWPVPLRGAYGPVFIWGTRWARRCMNTSDVGDITEAKIAAALLASGHSILKPFSRMRYDLLIDRRDGQFDRVQCKTGTINSGAVKFRTASSGGYGYAPRQHYRGQAEYFGVYCQENDTCYLVPVNEVGLTYGFLRLVPTKNGKKARLLASDFKI